MKKKSEKISRYSTSLMRRWLMMTRGWPLRRFPGAAGSWLLGRVTWLGHFAGRRRRIAAAVFWQGTLIWNFLFHNMAFVRRLSAGFLSSYSSFCRSWTCLSHPGRLILRFETSQGPSYRAIKQLCPISCPEIQRVGPVLSIYSSIFEKHFSASFGFCHFCSRTATWQTDPSYPVTSAPAQYFPENFYYKQMILDSSSSWAQSWYIPGLNSPY